MRQPNPMLPWCRAIQWCQNGHFCIPQGQSSHPRTTRIKGALDPYQELRRPMSGSRGGTEFSSSLCCFPAQPLGPKCPALPLPSLLPLPGKAFLLLGGAVTGQWSSLVSCLHRVLIGAGLSSGTVCFSTLWHLLDCPCWSNIWIASTAPA